MSTLAFQDEIEVLFTGEEAFQKGFPYPYELIDGRVIEMSPTGGQHGFVESRLTRFLDTFVSSQRIGWVLNGEVGIYTQREPDRVRGADVAFFTHDALPDGPPVGFIEAAPALVIEIMSPGDRAADVWEKMREYFAIGAGQVWIVEPSRRLIHVYRSPLKIEILDSSATIRGEGALDGFELMVAEIFA